MKYIRMHAHHPINLTVADYEQLLRDVRGRVLSGDGGISDVILLALIKDNEHRYYELKHEESGS